MVEAEVLRASNGGLGGWGQVLPRLAPGLYLRVDALQYLYEVNLADQTLNLGSSAQ